MVSSLRTILKNLFHLKGIGTVNTLPSGAAYSFDYARKQNGLMPAVLIVHGWQSSPLKEGGSYETLARMLNEAGYHTMRLCLRGHEGAHGDINKVTLHDHVCDIREAVQFLQSNLCVDPARLSAIGTSYGGYLLATLSPELKDFTLLALRAPALYPNRGWLEPSIALTKFPDRIAWRSVLRTGEESRALRNLAGFKGNILLVTSQNDEDMPPQVGRSYELAASSCSSFSNVELPGADHSLTKPADRQKFLNETRLWFEKHYPTPHTAPSE